jgi:hypothetical protein
MNSTARSTLAAALFLSSAILLAAWQIAPAIMKAGTSLSNAQEAFLRTRSEIGTALLVPAWIAILAAVGILLWPLIRYRKPNNVQKQPLNT